jgi:Protein of unknown function (DUF2905)
MSGHAGFGWVLLVLGLVITGVGLVWILAPSIPWPGRLPGDIRIERESFRFYFPLGRRLGERHGDQTWLLSFIDSARRSTCWRISAAGKCTRWPWPGKTHSKRYAASRSIDPACCGHEYQQ